MSFVLRKHKRVAVDFFVVQALQSNFGADSLKTLLDTVKVGLTNGFDKMTKSNLCHLIVIHYVFTW